jgi:cardiolipin synthase A/B
MCATHLACCCPNLTRTVGPPKPIEPINAKDFGAELETNRRKTLTAMMFKRSGLTCAACLLVALFFSSCGTITNARALIHTQALYFENPQLTGPQGPLTPRQAQRIVSRLKENQQTPSNILDRHIVFEQAISDTPLVTGNHVTLLKNGAATYAAMLAAIHGATDNINIEMYTFSDGPIGQMFADALIERQRHGVQVNVSYDSLGSITTAAAFFYRMRENGIAVLQYRPVHPFSVRLPWTLGHRDHRKLLVVDGRIAFTGGINISEVYASGMFSSKSTVPSTAWRDTDIEVEGPAVAEFQKIFITQWYYQKGPLLKPRDYFPSLERQGNQIVRVISSVPERFSLIYVTLISAIVNAETDVYITDAYFAPDHQMLHALEHAAQRGVDVRLLLPSRSDEPLIVSAARSHYSDLLKAGVKIYEWQGEMLHAKTATVDGVWSTVGTSNLDWWSIARNNELNAIILSHSFGTTMEQMFNEDLKNAKEIEAAEWKHRGLEERLKEIGADTIEPLL